MVFFAKLPPDEIFSDFTGHAFARRVLQSSVSLEVVKRRRRRLLSENRL